MPTSTVSVCTRHSQAFLPFPLRPGSAAAPLVAPVQPRPFVKWAGGKRQLLPEILARFPETFGRYWEPFVGGGAVFFGLAPTEAVLSDANRELINVYVCLRDNVDGVIARLRQHVPTHEHYYRVRAQRVGDLSGVSAAARTIFLNRTCYNGLFRVNRRGEFNVPFGWYDNPKICNESNLRRVSNALQGAELRAQSAFALEPYIKRGDLVFFDPPYHPVSATASFVSYTRSGFGRDEQVQLAEIFARLAGRGVNLVLTNSDTRFVRRLYRDFRIDTVAARRSINSRADRRGAVGEVIVSNTD